MYFKDFASDTGVYLGHCQTFMMDRSSCPEVFCKKDALRNFAKFTGKHLCQNLFFIKVAGLSPATLLKKRDSGTGAFL